MKLCSKCNAIKPESSFYVKNKKTRARYSYCIECQAAFGRGWYKLNRQKTLDRTRARNKLIAESNTAYIWSYLESHPCVDCGESDPVVLEFDHVDQSNKTSNVSDMRVRSIKSIDAEIAKCEVRCANCHRRRTATQLGWYKNMPS